MCYTPVMIKDDNGDRRPFPCGKCPPCLARRVHGWAFRFKEELKRSNSACVITLTYDSQYFDEENVSPEGELQLSLRHLQLFFKRLRKAHGKDYLYRIKYYAVGEYGSDRFRPHYHILLFNSRLELIQDSWSKGSVYYDVEFKDAAVYYCLKYMMKWSNSKYAKNLSNSDRKPEFSVMSKRIGDNYVKNDSMVRWHKADLGNRMYLNLPGNVKVAMPRYYKDKIYSDEEREEISFIQSVKAVEKNKEYQEKMIARFGDEWEKVHSEMVRSEYSKMYNKAKQNRKL